MNTTATIKQRAQFDSGKFAIGKDSKGNFSAYSSELGRVFIPKGLMESKGWKEDKDVKFPFFGLVEHVEKDLTDMNGKSVLDENGEVKRIVRNEAKSIFATDTEMLASSTFSERSAAAAEALVNQSRLDAKLAIAKKVKEAGLTEDTLKALLEA